MKKVTIYRHNNFLIIRDLMAGNRDAYYVIHMRHDQPKYVGRELPLKMAKQIAEKGCQDREIR